MAEEYWPRFKKLFRGEILYGSKGMLYLFGFYFCLICVKMKGVHYIIYIAMQVVTWNIFWDMETGV